MRLRRPGEDMLAGIVVPIAREGWIFVAIFAIVTILLLALLPVLGFIALLLTAWCVYFFRDPERVSPNRGGLVITPADGVVQMIVDRDPPVELDMPAEPVVRVSVFMNVFDCHVNRVPCDGRIGRLVYIPGRFFNAAFDKASDQNERQLIRLDLDNGQQVATVQIAGLVARRIACYLRDGQQVVAGERFGLIRFGSRLDVYLPVGVTPLVAVGQRCIAGETVLADLRSGESQRFGEVR